MKIRDLVVKSIMTKGKSGDGMIVGLSAEKGEFISQSGELVKKIVQYKIKYKVYDW